MKVLVCGSRDWTDRRAVSDRLMNLPPYTTIIHGGARGADMFAADFAASCCFDAVAFPADWGTYGKRAGILRNLRMLDAEPDLVIAFQRDGSRGTQHTIDEARKRGIAVEVHTA